MVRQAKAGSSPCCLLLRLLLRRLLLQLMLGLLLQLMWWLLAVLVASTLGRRSLRCHAWGFHMEATTISGTLGLGGGVDWLSKQTPIRAS